MSTHRATPQRNTSTILRSKAALLIIASALAVIVVGVIIAGFSTNFGHNSGSSQDTMVQPASAKKVADSLNCTRFKDLGGGMPSGLGERLYVVDSGYCFIGDKKYAIDTFASKGVRDQWLPLAEQLGVVPKWETDTSVTYPSVD